MKHFIHFLMLTAALAAMVLTPGCSKKDEPAPKDDNSSISAFVFESFDPSVEGVISGTSITATVPYTADASKLTPTITIAATSKVAPASGVEQDFTSPVEYTVTAEDGTDTKYTVTVTVADPPKLKVEPKWERTLANGGLPSWFTANNDKDIALGGDFVYVHNNNDKIRVVSAADGTDQEAGNGTGFLDAKQNFASGNLFLMSVATDDNGVILGANLRVGNGNNPWNVYKWDDKDADQELYFGTYAPPVGVALSDNIAVVGSVAGNGYIYAAGDGFFGKSNQVFKFEIANGEVNAIPTIITIQSDDFTELGNANDVYPVSDAADANIILAGTSVGVSEYTAEGTLVGKLPEALKEEEDTAPLFTFALDVIPFELDGRKVIATTATDFTENKADSGWLYLIDYTDGWENLTADNIVRVAFTPDGNIDSNINGTGGVDVAVDGDEAAVYAIITNFGIGAYDVSFE